MRQFILRASVLMTLAAAAGAEEDGATRQGLVDTVIVTATRDPNDPPVVAAARERLSRTPGSVAVVAAETYSTRAIVGIPDLLRDVPGVLSNKRYGEESRLSIRGSGIDQSFHQRGVLIAQDGVPFANADGFSDFQKVDPLAARYIEVYKGGNALRFGGAQLGGAVNLITPTGRTSTFDNTVRVESGSYGTLRGSGSIARAAGSWDIYALVSALSADGYRRHSAQEQGRATLNLGYRHGEEQEVRLIVYGADIDQEVPGPLGLSDALQDPRRARSGVEEQGWARDQKNGRLSVQTRWRFTDGLLLEGGLYATRTELHHPIPIVIDQDGTTQGAFGRLDWQGVLAGLGADLFAGLSFRRGAIDQGLFNNEGGRHGFKFGHARLEASGLDVFAEGRLFVIDRLALVAGGSFGRARRDYSNWRDRTNDASKTFDWFAPRIGLLWESDSGTQVYANLTRSVEPPHYGALVQAPHPGFVPVEPQKARTAEIGTRGRTGALTWDIAAYRSEIEGELLSFTAQAGYPGTFFNAGDTLHQGFEASLDWRMLEGESGTLSLRQTYAWSYFELDGDRLYGDNRLPVVPEHQYRAMLRYEHPAGLFIAPMLDWRPQRVLVDYANTLEAPGYALLNVDLGWRFANGLSCFLDARNLGNKRHVAEFGAITDARTAAASVFYPGEGRSAFLGLSYSY